MKLKRIGDLDSPAISPISEQVLKIVILITVVYWFDRLIYGYRPYMFFRPDILDTFFNWLKADKLWFKILFAYGLVEGFIFLPITEYFYNKEMKENEATRK